MKRPRPSLLLSETDATGHNANKYPGKRHTHPGEEQDNGTHVRYRPVTFTFHRQSTGHDDGLPSGQHPPAGSYNRQDFPPAARHPVLPRFGQCSSFRHRRFYPSGKTLLYRVARMPSRFSHHPLKKAEPGHTGIPLFHPTAIPESEPVFHPDTRLDFLGITVAFLTFELRPETGIS